MTTDTPGKDPPKITPEQAAQVVSRQLGLPLELEAVRTLADRVATSVNQNPTLRAAGPEGLKAFIWAITPEDPARMDPAKQAEAMLARANVTSSDNVAWGKVLDSFRLVASGRLTGEEARRAQSEAALMVLDLGKIDQNNFAATEFRMRGLDYGTFDKLRHQGFNAQQILAAAGLSKELKIDVNVNAGAIARLQRDVPGIETSLRQSRDNWHAVGEYERKEAEASQRGDREAAAQWHKRGQEAKKRAERHDHEEHDHVQRVRPDRVPDLDDTHRHIRAANSHLDAATSGLTPEKAKAVKAAAKAAYLGDANAQVELEQKVGKFPATSRRFVQESEKEQKKVAAVRDAKASNTRSTVIERDSQQAKNDDLLAALNDENTPTTTIASSEVPVQPSRLRQATLNAAAKPSQPTA